MRRVHSLLIARTEAQRSQLLRLGIVYQLVRNTCARS